MKGCRLFIAKDFEGAKYIPNWRDWKNPDRLWAGNPLWVYSAGRTILLPKYLHFGEAQIVRASELHANIAALRDGCNVGGWIGRRGLMAAPRPDPVL